MPTTSVENFFSRIWSSSTSNETGLCELSISLYRLKAWKCTFVKLAPELCTHIHIIFIYRHTSSKYGQLWAEMICSLVLITILHVRTRWSTPRSRDTHLNILWSRTNINENYLIHRQSIGRVPCYMWWLICRVTSLFPQHEQWSRDSSLRILFLEVYPISASLFLFRGSKIKLFIAIYLWYFCAMLWHEQNITIHLTSNMLTPNDISSHSHCLWSHTCKSPPLSSWNHDNSPNIRHTPSNDNTSQSHRSGHPCPHFLYSDIIAPNFREHLVMNVHQCLYKGVICPCQVWFCSCFIPSLSKLNLHLCFCGFRKI